MKLSLAGTIVKVLMGNATTGIWRGYGRRGLTGTCFDLFVLYTPGVF